MALGSCAQRSSCINLLAGPTREQDELAGQGLVEVFNTKSNEALTKAIIPPEAPIPPCIPLSTKDLFT